jgi:glycosyltransferase-like protein LARGE
VSWGSYLSVAIYIEDKKDKKFLQFELEKLRQKLKGRLSHDAKIDVSLLYGYEFIANKRIMHHPYDFLYPINALRNLALSQCQSPYILSMDVDFVLSKDAKSVVQDHLRLFDSENRKNPLALVIPVFEWIFQKEEMPVSMDMKKLRTYCGRNRLIPFHAKKLDKTRYSRQDLQDWCSGRTSTPKHVKITRVQYLSDYSRWLRSTKAYPISKNPQILDVYYEPYFVALKSEFPPFDERFRGYGFNKRSSTMAMQYLEYSFMVLPKVFGVHRYHEPSTWRQTLQTEDLVSRTLGRTFEQFKRDLKESKRKRRLIKRE